MSGSVGHEAELFALDAASCRTLLRTQPVGRLVIAGSEPQVVPVNFELDDDAIALRTEPGSAAAQAVDRPVAFEVDMYDVRTCSGWSVVARGVLRRTDPPGAAVRTWAPGRRELALTIAIEAVTGRLLRGAIPAWAESADGYL